MTLNPLKGTPLSLDLGNTGWSAQDFPKLNVVWETLRQESLLSEKAGFYNAPISEKLSQHEATRSFVRQIASRQPAYRDCLFLGIGGSTLGPRMLLDALQDRIPSGAPRFHFLENPDPWEWRSHSERLNPQDTLLCVVTKSGTTFETLALFLHAQKWMGLERFRAQTLFITDPARGELRQIATQEGIPTLEIAPSIGGRFSLFSPVGLFPLMLSRLDSKALMEGAAQFRTYAEATPASENPLFQLGAALVHRMSTHPIHVWMPYASRLKSLGEWFTQLWAESLGKEGRGFTPLSSLGATDQHSLLQLLRDGPPDKVIFFFTLQKILDDPLIPPALFPTESRVHPTLDVLAGRGLHELLTMEYEATRLVFEKQRRPHLTFQLESLDERSLGALCFALATLTAFTGQFLGVNPFDQPGVEEGKIYLRQALEKKSSVVLG